MLGNLLDEYIEGNFYVGNNEKIPPEKLELAPLIERIAETKLFLNNDGIPMSKSTLTKMAEKMWQKDKRVRHNEKHKEKSPQIPSPQNTDITGSSSKLVICRRQFSSPQPIINS